MNSFDRALAKSKLRKPIHKALWQAALEEIRTDPDNEIIAKRLSLLVHATTSKNPLYSFILQRSAELTCQAVEQLRKDIEDAITPDPEHPHG